MALTLEQVTERLMELERWRDGEQRRLMQAIHDTVAEQGRTLVRLETALVNQQREMGSVRLELGSLRSEMHEGFALVGEKFGQVESGLQAIAATLARIENGNS